jgi:hypothetical protein
LSHHDGLAAGIEEHVGGGEQAAVESAAAEFREDGGAFAGQGEEANGPFASRAEDVTGRAIR